MSLSHLIAAGAIVVRDDTILLVRFRDPRGGTYLVGPGGGVVEHESVADAAVRETLEETGVWVAPEGMQLRSLHRGAQTSDRLAP